MSSPMPVVCRKRSSSGNEDASSDDSSNKRARSMSRTRKADNNHFDGVDPFKMQKIKQQIEDIAQKIEKTRRASSGHSSEATMRFGSTSSQTSPKSTTSGQVDTTGQVDFGFGADTSGDVFTFSQPVYKDLAELTMTLPETGSASPSAEAPKKKRSKTQKRAETLRRKKIREQGEREAKRIEAERAATELRRAKQLRKKLNAIRNHSIPGPPSPPPMLMELEAAQVAPMDPDVESWGARMQDELLEAKAEMVAMRKTIKFLMTHIQALKRKEDMLTRINDHALKEMESVRTAAARLLHDGPDITVEERQVLEGKMAHLPSSQL
ncbi:hypothetical protein QBC45DRAFT_334249 [Copromyces sp. CBS 386.78]|nr:hypothetical protein QBC45DRAFT_334249 [Copromyces sp. CBS 386.78]